MNHVTAIVALLFISAAASVYGEGEDFLPAEEAALGLPTAAELTSSQDNLQIEANAATAELQQPGDNEAQPLENPEPELLPAETPPSTRTPGRPIHSAIQQIRELENTTEEYDWSFGIGTQYFLQHSVYPQGNFQMAMGKHASLGILFGGMGSFGTSGSMQVTQYLATFNLHGDRSFRGLWIQVGGGITVFKTQPAPSTTEGDVFSRPTALGAVGWRWNLPDAIGRDDGFSFSLSLGGEAFFGTVSAGSFSTSGVRVLPIGRAEVNFGF